MANTWECELVILLRGLIDDSVTPYTYTDAKLVNLIAISAQLIKKDFDFDTEYTVNLEQQTISPDPTSDRDDIFINLSCLKAACLVLQGEVKQAASQAFRIVDGPSTIEVADVHKSKKELLNKMCDDYDRAKIEYKINNLSVVKAILSPYGGDFSIPGSIFGV